MAKKIEKSTIKKSVASGPTSDYAVISTGGKQYLVKQNDKLSIEKIDIKPGETLKLKDMLSGKDVVIKHLEQQKGKKISIWKFKNKTRYLKRKGHRQSYSKVEVESIK